jgi:large-conductance mechanosensitive channel
MTTPVVPESIYKFILKEKLLTLTLIGSIFTFAFVGSLKCDIIDPLLQFVLSEEYFGFMDITIREGDKPPKPRKNIELKFGNFFREFITWIIIVITLFTLYKYTSFPDQKSIING